MDTLPQEGNTATKQLDTLFDRLEQADKREERKKQGLYLIPQLQGSLSYFLEMGKELGYDIPPELVEEILNLREKIKKIPIPKEFNTP